MLAPVIIFVYNRPEHTQKTIEYLAKNYLSEQTDVFVFCDGAKDNNNDQDIMKVRDYIKSVSEKNYFNSFHISISDENRGLAKSVINGVSEVLNDFGKVIVVEDDLITSNYFLEFMNEALDYYENKKNIWSISGYNLPIKIPKDYSHDIYCSLRGASWGWGTWIDRWSKVDWEVQDYKKFQNDKKLKRRFNRGGRDLSKMLDLQMAGKIDSWAIRWVYAQFKLNSFTIYPVHTRVINIGMDGSGTHSGKTNRFNSEFKDEYTVETYFEDVTLNNTIIRRFSNYYMSNFKYITISVLKKIKIIIYKIIEVKNV